MTKEIELTQGEVTLVDDDLYEELNRHKWCVTKSANKNSKHYACRNVRRGGKKHMILMHRQILGLVRGDGKVSDHINRNPLDNRKANLRVANHTINNRNRGIESTNTSGHKGVCWDISRDKWMAHITVNDRQINLGRYDMIDEAIEARNCGEDRYW